MVLRMYEVIYIYLSLYLPTYIQMYLVCLFIKYKHNDVCMNPAVRKDVNFFTPFMKNCNCVICKTINLKKKKLLKFFVAMLKAIFTLFTIFLQFICIRSK